ncbi:MAG: nucleoside triphosphate pyrophosphohydrolase [Spirochaetes bacterium]|nr:nucleoside triphosphate pyrophosphohydrolase [Spirochaetota bacterium]
MARLRRKDGCPWDREQSHESLKPYIIEETYEVLDAIDRKDDDELREELGDVLLQIVFHAQIAAEQSRFTMDDVAAAIVEKLKRRHPHVFGNVEVEDSREVLRNWEEIKKEEGKDSVLDGVPDGLPALLKAQRVQEKVRRVGFDWESIGGTFDKVREEIGELEKAVKDGDQAGIEDEFGDILFSLVNVARFLDINAEESLRQTTKKFSHRFRYIENRIEEKGERPIEEYSLEELDALWNEAKSY